MKKETIFLELMNHGKVPVYANHNDAGADVFASEDFVLCPGETKVLPLKIKVALPDHLEMQVRPRSGRRPRHHGALRRPRHGRASFGRLRGSPGCAALIECRVQIVLAL